ncbi:MAG: molybdopterin synthase [Methanocellales archaeon]
MKVISITGYKNSGKTDLTVKLVEALKQKGKVGTVKHMHAHRFDKKGSDTYRHMQAGADVVVGVTPYELVKLTNANNLKAALDELANAGVDYAVVEGFKDSLLPKIAIGEVKAANIIKTLDPHGDLNIDELVELVESQREWITFNSLVNKVKKNRDIAKTGAIATFTGIVRGINKGVKIRELQFEHYEEMLDKTLEKIKQTLKQREGIVEVLIHHKSGVIPAGEDIIYIVVAGSHRKEVFKALSDAIEMVKTQAPIWKKEVTEIGEYWVQEVERK